MLKEIHEQADAVAETIADRTVRDDGVDLDDAATLDERPAARRQAHRRSSPAAPRTTPASSAATRSRSGRACPVEIDIASEYRYRNPVVGPGDLVIGITQSGETADTLAAMRLARERGATVLAVTNIMGSQATRDADGVALHARRPRGRRRRDEDVRLPGRGHVPARAAARRAARHARRRAAAPSSSPSSSACRTRSTSCSRRVDARRSSAIAERHWRARVLPLPRPPRRPAGRARGRAQAQGDLLHPDRRLRGRRDEARPDRAARRVARRSSPSPPTRRCSTRSSRTCRRSAPAARTSSPSRPRATRRSASTPRRSSAVPRHGLDAPAAARGHPAAAAGLPDRAPARAERRPAAQPREDRHGRVGHGLSARPPTRSSTLAPRHEGRLSAWASDLLEIERLERALERRPGLAQRLFTEAERAYAAARARPGAAPGGALLRQGGGGEGAGARRAGAGATSRSCPGRRRAAGDRRLHGALAERARRRGRGLADAHPQRPPGPCAVAA